MAGTRARTASGKAQASSKSAWQRLAAADAGGERQAEQDPRLPGRQVRRGDPAARDERADGRHAARRHARRLDHGDAGGRGALQRLDLGRGGVAGARAGAHDPAGAGRDGGIDHDPVRTLVADHHVNTVKCPEVHAGEAAAERGAPPRDVVDRSPARPRPPNPAAPRRRRGTRRPAACPTWSRRGRRGSCRRGGRGRPRPRASGEAATRTALTRLSGPSAESAEAGRIAPVTTTGPSPATTRWRSQAVSSSVLVPCVMTTPSASSRSSWSRDRGHEVREVGVGQGVGPDAAERDLARHRRSTRARARSPPAARRAPGAWRCRGTRRGRDGRPPASRSCRRS